MGVLCSSSLTLRRKAAELVSDWLVDKGLSIAFLAKSTIITWMCYYAAALRAADTLTCALAHVEESVPYSAAASIQLPLWERAGVAGFPGHFRDQRLAVYIYWHSHLHTGHGIVQGLTCQSMTFIQMIPYTPTNRGHTCHLVLLTAAT